MLVKFVFNRIYSFQNNGYGVISTTRNISCSNKVSSLANLRLELKYFFVPNVQSFLQAFLLHFKLCDGAPAGTQGSLVKLKFRIVNQDI